MKSGDRIKYRHYGEIKEATVEGLSADGSIVFLKGKGWIHRASVVDDLSR